jgi:two-component system sensor histidine kinase KdpD
LKGRRYLAAVGGVAGGTLALYLLRPHVDRPHASLLYLLIVVLVATSAGLGPAILAALLSFLAWNFFLLEPLFTFYLAQRGDVLTLLVFLGVAILTGELAGRARERAAEAEARLREISMLQRMGAVVAEQVETSRVLPALLDQAAQLCGGARAVLLPGDPAGPAGEPAAGGRGVKGFNVPLEVDGRRVGTLGIDVDPAAVSASDRLLLKTLASYAALAMERQRLNEEAATVAGLRAADDLKTALLSAVSHDLKTPLASILASLANLRRRRAAGREALPSAELGEALAAIEEEAKRLSALVSDLLDLSRLESGAWQPKREWYDLPDILGSVLSRFPEAEAARVRLILPEELPMVEVDGGQIAQVLWNLLDNALKYAPAGSPVTLSAARAGAELRVSVTDEGPGIDPREREQVFHRFYRRVGPGAPDAAVPGTGLGLAICRGLVEAHAGRIWVEGGAQGARLVFTLPAPQGMDASDDPADPGSG